MVIDAGVPPSTPELNTHCSMACEMPGAAAARRGCCCLSDTNSFTLAACICGRGQCPTIHCCRYCCVVTLCHYQQAVVLCSPCIEACLQALLLNCTALHLQSPMIARSRGAKSFICCCCPTPSEASAYAHQPECARLCCPAEGRLSRHMHLHRYHERTSGPEA